MEIDLARHVVRAAFRSSRQISELIPLLKEHCSSEEYKSYAFGIAAAIDRINVELMNKVCAEHPQLEKEIEADTAKYGRFL